MADDKLELERELSDIRKEVIESRNLVIKTDNLLKNLHAELKEVGRRQKEFQTKQMISSATAYVLFTLLAVGAAIWASNAATSGVYSERTRLEKAVADLTEQVAQAKGNANSDLAARKAANEVYRMMTELPGEERLKGIDAFSKLDTSRLSPLEKQALNDRTTILRRELGQAAFERGKNAFRRNEMSAAAEELNRFLTMNPPEADQLDASFFLGGALAQLRKHEQALPHLVRFVNGDKRSKTRDYAMLLLAGTHEALGQPEKAAEIAREALGTYPNSEFTGQLKARLSSAKRVIKGDSATAEATAPGASAPVAGAPPAPPVAAPAPTPTPAAAAAPGPATPGR